MKKCDLIKGGHTLGSLLEHVIGFTLTSLSGLFSYTIIQPTDFLY